MADALLSVESLVSGYGRLQVLGGVSLFVQEGEIVVLIGHNGSGKSTLLKAIFGLIPAWSGLVSFRGEPVSAKRTHGLIRRGVTYLPQGGRVFRELTVKENLNLAGSPFSRQAVAARIEEVLSIYVDLRDLLGRPAWTLSGGQRQLVALGMALIPRPRLLLADEPSLGLAPPLVKEALARFEHLRTQGTAVLLVEQKVREALRIAQRVYVLRNGNITWSGAAEVLKRNTQKLKEVYL